MSGTRALEERLRTFAPADDDSDWAEVMRLAELPQQSRRSVRAIPRRWLVFAVAAVLLLGTGGAVAAVVGVPWWENAAPPVNHRVADRAFAPSPDSSFPPAPDRSRARTVATAEGAALVAAPVGADGYCLLPSLAGSPYIGSSCLYQNGDELRSYARPGPAGTARWLLYGRITDPDAETLDLTEAAGVPFEIELEPGGFFIANVPTDRWDELANRAGEGRILDASGTTLRTGCVDWGAGPAGPRAGEGRPGFWRNGSGPCVPVPVRPPQVVDVSRAVKLFELTLTASYSVWKAGTTIAFWQAPASDGELCVVTGTPAAPDQRGNRDCRDPWAPWLSAGAPFQTGFGAQRARVEGRVVYLWTVHGWIAPAAAIARLELRSASGTTAVPFARGYFFVQLPGTSGTVDDLPDEGPYTLVGYGADGTEVARRALALWRGGS